MVDDVLDRVVVVLVRARNPANIGAVARAMHDFGYSRLRVVNEFHVPFEAAKSAVDAASVLMAAGEFEGVAEAIADCTLVLGTTAVGSRVLEHRLDTLAQAAPKVRGHLAADAKAKVALLFGSEKTGLSNDELSYCHGLMTIPMSACGGERHLSMNLGQAAAVCLYVLRQESEPTAVVEEVGAVGAELERLSELLVEVLKESGYARRHPANAREAVVRRLVRRMGLGENDALVWTGVLRQVLWRMQGTGGG